MASHAIQAIFNRIHYKKKAPASITAPFYVIQSMTVNKPSDYPLYEHRKEITLMINIDVFGRGF